MEHLSPEIQDALASELTIDITTTGRRSGKQRRIEIWFLHVDDRVWIAGTPGRRDWMANLLAEPSFTFHLKGATTADLAATARPVTDVRDRTQVFASEAAEWYRRQRPLDELVATAPLVEVSFA